MTKIIEESIKSSASKVETTDENFKFGIDILDKSIELIHAHTISSYKQISAIVIIDLAYLCSYSSLKGTEHYVFDTSPSATGKDSSADRSYQLHLQPIMQLQKERHHAHILETQKSDEPPVLKSFHCIHTADATPQAIYVGFSTTNSQYVRLGEMGNKLAKKDHPLTNFVTDMYGKHTLAQPNYKKDLGSSMELVVDDVNLFFYGNSNMQMMGINTFMHHLKGGLLNRAILVHNTYTREFEDKPESYDIPEKLIWEANKKVVKILEFLQAHETEDKPKIPRTQIYKDFDRYIFDKSREIEGTAVQDLFKRAMQNLNAIILTLHYLKCGEAEMWKFSIDEDTVFSAVRYMEYIIDGYDVLMDEVIGVTKDKANETNSDRIHKKIIELSVNKHKIKHRDIYRPLHLNRKDYDQLVKEMNYRVDKKYLHVLPTVTK